MDYKTIRLPRHNHAYAKVAVIERPKLSFIDLISWLVVLVFGLKASTALSLALFLSL